MKPTEELIQEHEAIRTMLRILTRVCQRIETGDKPDIADLKLMLDFFSAFADGCHHAKEEEYLFPAMERAGIPREHGPVGVMLSEHELGRKYIRGMRAAIDQHQEGNAGALKLFAQHAMAYRNLLDQHIEKENQILFPMAEQRLTEQEFTRMAAEFEKIETERIGVGRHEEFHRHLKELSAAYLN